MPQFLTTAQGRTIAYERSPAASTGTGPGIVFLGGFLSDMQGTKALALQAWAQGQGRAFLRFDYSGHGQSSERFEDGTIGTWAEDARAVLETLTEGPQLLVGSSMGGWIALLLARDCPDRVAGLVTIAAAPDFTEDLMWAGFDAAARDRLARDGRIELPSDYAGGDPMVITRALIEDGRARLVLRDPLPLPGPARFLQGTADAEVPVAVALRLLDHATGPDLRLTLVKGVDHRFSTPDCLSQIEAAVAEVSALCTGFGTGFGTGEGQAAGVGQAAGTGQG